MTNIKKELMLYTIIMIVIVVLFTLTIIFGLYDIAIVMSYISSIFGTIIIIRIKNI